jgi:hypothetical protein
LRRRKAKNGKVVELAELDGLNRHKGNRCGRHGSASSADREHPNHQTGDGLAHYDTSLFDREAETPDFPCLITECEQTQPAR